MRPGQVDEDRLLDPPTCSPTPGPIPFVANLCQLPLWVAALRSVQEGPGDSQDPPGALTQPTEPLGKAERARQLPRPTVSCRQALEVNPASAVGLM